MKAIHFFPKNQNKYFINRVRDNYKNFKKCKVQKNKKNKRKKLNVIRENKMT